MRIGFPTTGANHPLTMILGRVLLYAGGGVLVVLFAVLLAGALTPDVTFSCQPRAGGARCVQSIERLGIQQGQHVFEGVRGTTTHNGQVALVTTAGQQPLPLGGAAAHEAAAAAVHDSVYSAQTRRSRYTVNEIESMPGMLVAFAIGLYGVGLTSYALWLLYQHRT